MESSARNELGRFRTRAPRRDAGLALIALILLLALIAVAGLFAPFQSAVRASTRALRDEETHSAIQSAKQALIARAALDLTRPGSLPCPAQNESGASSGICPGANQRIGRLPWKQLGLPVPVAGNAEPLWYALADAFRDTDTNVVNSDTGDIGDPDRAKMLEIVGAAAQEGVAAVIIDPGPVLAGQDRRAANRINAAHYLEGDNNPQRDPGGRNDGRFATGIGSEAFNDVVVALTREELFAVVDNAVALRIDRVIRPALEAYLAAWQALPYSTDGFNPAADLVSASLGRYEGHLPILLPPGKRIAWRSIAAPRQAAGDAANFLDEAASSCATDANDASILVCTLVYQGEPEVRIEGRIDNLALALAGPVRLLASTPSWPEARAQPIASGALDDSGGATFTVVTRLPPPPGAGKYRGELRFGAPQNLLDPATANDDYAWFAQNGWNRLVFYRVGDGARRGAASRCAEGTPASCIELRRADGASTRAAAVLIHSGIRLAGRVRPSSDRADYLEGANALGTTAFEQRPQSPVFNDRMIAIRKLD